MKLSIITINFNNAIGLSKTLNSVSSQTFKDLEHIVIDGGSSDGSKEVILKYEKHLSYWCSEQDAGIYNAMNKGILKSKGDYLLFLNSGDFLAEADILERVFFSFPEKDIVYGDLIFASKDGNRTLAVYPDVLDARYLLEDALPHPASFIRRKLFENSLYSENYKIVSDWEFWVKKILIEEASYEHLPFAISIFEAGGISSDGEKCNVEREHVLRKLFPGMVYPALQSWCKMQSQPFYPLFEEICATRRFQRRIQPLVRMLLRLNNFFSKKKY